MRDFNGKTAVVTGGASGVGRCMCDVYVREGMNVALLDIEQAALDKAVEELKAKGANVVGIRTDVTDPESVNNAADQIFETFGNVHLLCNNAGVGIKEAERRIWTLTPNDWTWGYNVNVMGIVNGIRAFVPRMLENDEDGHVVNTTSGNGGCFSMPTTPIYSSTKAAVTSLTEVMNYQLLTDGAKLQAHLLFPGPYLVNTQILASQRNRHDEFKDEQEVADYTSMEDLKKASAGADAEFNLTEPEEVAETCLEGIRQGQFWIRPYVEEHQEKVRTRYESLLNNTNPVLP
ncbi:SDR family NAD(P)-dependent oxidoreductase [Halieaceae bacterium]|nr:SDR family NAD(P)-dependent oxidoreductase [Halieaceae bacterium]